MDYKRLRLLAPVVFWVFQIIVNIIRNIYVVATKSFLVVVQTMLPAYPMDIITFSIFYFFITPRFYKKENIRTFTLISIFYPVLYGFLWVLSYYVIGLRDIETMKLFYLSSYGHSLLYAFYGVVFRLAIDWFEDREKRRELEKQNMKIELALLRSQVNPHFLFNILNNINSFANKNSEKTSFAIVKLSEIMRYMLYEAKEGNVFIQKEIQHIRNYLDLQRLRYKTSDFIDFNCDCKFTNIKIPPMLFIPFIENAFKHGKKSVGSKISIKIEVKADYINFYCENEIRKLNETEKNEPGGIGVKNIKRRLELLYPGKHELIVENSNNMYTVQLIIETT